MNGGGWCSIRESQEDGASAARVGRWFLGVRGPQLTTSGGATRRHLRARVWCDLNAR
jgi:hypothetical protein